MLSQSNYPDKKIRTLRVCNLSSTNCADKNLHNYFLRGRLGLAGRTGSFRLAATPRRRLSASQTEGGHGVQRIMGYKSDCFAEGGFRQLGRFSDEVHGHANARAALLDRDRSKRAARR
jgi:hypothetical protein